MPRVRKGSARPQARKRMLRQARGYFGTNSKHWYRARNAVVRAGVYAYADRRRRNRGGRSAFGGRGRGGFGRFGRPAGGEGEGRGERQSAQSH